MILLSLYSIIYHFNCKEYTHYKGAQQAIKEMNGTVIAGGRITVEEARPKDLDDSIF
jgi:hypothetical protein